MQCIDIELDAGVFSHSAAVATAQRYTDRYSVEIRRVGDKWALHLAASAIQEGEEALRADVLRDALDEQMREVVRARTGRLHEALVEAALRGARPVAAE